ncbi:hypothetical protein QYE76_011047 [Lolium multiflorum]|uniref:Retrotransposon gag domain-containing protein n=1 Tax=Lolium multiflorum TaxID=4521 RepID=A0AAD8TYG9_LOLMU|nr:hypothetical protein QYE76_011047 [Lolium multiflorum]
MLLGSARTWLNNLPAGSINGWLDFEEAFISNFSGTYRRPGRPQQLEMCKQGPDETDRAYLTRWCEMRNSCEGVHEIQAVGFFMGGCRPNTMLFRRLVQAGQQAGRAQAGQGGHHGSRRDNYRDKRHNDQPDPFTVPPMWQPCRTTRRRRQRRSTDRPQAEYTFERMLDSPCKYHAERTPPTTPHMPLHEAADSASHFRLHRLYRRLAGWPARENANLEHHEANQVHHGGRYLAEDATYIIFTIEPEDKTSQQRRSLEVNAVMPLVPQYLNW